MELTKADRTALESLRRKYNDYRSERALAVLHCSAGMTATKIAELLQRTVQTVCSWLHAYQKDGINGLSRDFSPGRPNLRHTRLLPRLEEYLRCSPRDYGWGEDVWSMKVMIAQFHKETGTTISADSVERALHDAGYSFKRAKKGVPVRAPSKEEKLARIKEIAKEITLLKADRDVEVMFLDESHFSTDPYVTRGWHKRGKPFFPGDTAKARKLHHLWGIRSGKRCFLLEEFEQKQCVGSQGVSTSITSPCRK